MFLPFLFILALMYFFIGISIEFVNDQETNGTTISIRSKYYRHGCTSASLKFWPTGMLLSQILHLGLGKYRCTKWHDVQYLTVQNQYLWRKIVSQKYWWDCWIDVYNIWHYQSKESTSYLIIVEEHIYVRRLHKQFLTTFILSKYLFMEDFL